MKVPIIKYLFSFIILLSATTAGGQELYPLTEAASTIPKGVIGIRALGKFYTQKGALRNMQALKIMYGLTPKITLILSAVGADHHSADLPPEYPTNHTHNTKVKYPYRFAGVHFYGKYRFLSRDAPNKHFRAAFYAEASLNTSAHDESEPDLMDDNSGWGTGIITTFLLHKFAVSFTGGIVKPRDYYGKVPDPIPGLPFVPAKVEYPLSGVFDLSFGYLLFPKKYKNYKQTNWNIYVELKGKAFGAPDISLSAPTNSPDKNVSYYKVFTQNNPLLSKGNYVDMHYGVQCILNSNVRIEGTVGFPLINKSLLKDYPIINIGFQKFFYR